MTMTWLFDARRMLSLIAMTGIFFSALVAPLPARAQFRDPGLQAQINRPFTDPRLNLTLLGQTETPVLAQTGTILPTDIVPLPAPREGQGFAQALQFRVLQRLPSKFYLNAINETSFRLETNPFQFPNSKQVVLNKLTGGLPLALFPQNQQRAINELVGDVNKTQQVFRELPNITAGWEFTPRTRAYANYFLIRDSLTHSIHLNTTIQSVGGGLQHDFPLGSKANLQANMQFRELFQSHLVPVFDYLPGLTLSYLVTPRTVAYVNTLLQLRGRRPFVAPTREIDPFYTVGVLYQRGRWQVATAGTFLQNFREPFRNNALIPINNYSFVCDFEIDRQLFKKYSGCQAFVRAEPIWNFHSNNTPGISGFDFRLFYGLRVTLGKVALTRPIQSIKQQLEDEEPTPPSPLQELTPSTSGPQSSLPRPRPKLIAHDAQPVHGYINDVKISDKAIVPLPIRLAPESY